MNKKDLDECWKIIWGYDSIYPVGFTLADQKRITEALKLAYKKGKEQRRARE